VPIKGQRASWRPSATDGRVRVGAVTAKGRAMTGRVDTVRAQMAQWNAIDDPV
jgi:hypothetical protein